MKKRLIILFSMLVIILSTNSCGMNFGMIPKRKNLQKKIEILEEENKKLKDELEKKEAAKEYINIKFFVDGKKYRVMDEEVNLYEDKYCNVLIKDEEISIVSPIIDTVEVPGSKEKIIFSVRAVKDGKTVILFSNLYPRLEVEQ